MNTMTEMAVQKGLELLTTATNLATMETPKVLNEYLNLMIFDATMGLTPILLITVIVFYGNKIINYGVNLNNKEIKDLTETLTATKDPTAVDKVKQQLRSTIKSNYTLKFFRFIMISIALTCSLYMGYSNVSRIGKLIIAPRVFLIQEGASLLKKGESTKQ